MKRMAQSSVLLVGLGGLGVEIAKNVALAGVKSLTLLDDRICSISDMGYQFFIQETDVNTKSRSIASAPRLAELNPYVSINIATGSIENMIRDKSILQYQCVILTETDLPTLVEVNRFCRSQSVPIKFICGDVYGLLASGFCDFGPDFHVADPSGEEPKQSFIGDITKANPGVVTTFDKGLHGLESGDYVKFREVNGMTALNGQELLIKVLTPYSYSICDTSSPDYHQYTHGGISTQVITPRTLSFESLEDQLNNPSVMTPDYSIHDYPNQLHIAYLTIHRLSTHIDGSSGQEIGKFLETAKSINSTLNKPVDAVNEPLLTSIAQTYKGTLPPLCAAMGGVLAQECLKSLTSKFTPLHQWLHLDATTLIGKEHIKDTSNFSIRNDCYDGLRQCIGDNLVHKLASLKLFMVGCGAIGCEMLKNFALLGISTESDGRITITDNDLIEKSNLNRQFLFRPHHIRQHKSTTAAASAKEINKDLKIVAHQHKVCPDTENNVYRDMFFESQDVCVNALDNIAARRYMDSRCVTNQRALLETGTMGSKGHVQVIVPHITESYTSQSDPADESIPYCTLKSFPATLDHCIQWARDKFESSFTQKPQLYNKFWTCQPDVKSLLEALQNDTNIENAIQISHIIPNKPNNWISCLHIARLKFEKYFNFRAKQLLHAFPLDSKLSDDTTFFWQSPKRPPTPLNFDVNNPLHYQFITTTSRLYADMEGITYKPQELTAEFIFYSLLQLEVPQFVPSGKRIETSPDAAKPVESDCVNDELDQAAGVIRTFLDSRGSNNLLNAMTPLSFEKDNDLNGHIDFISAAANLRASMYNIDTGDRLDIKRIAGRIIPAIATTTATIAGLATIELLKVVQGCRLEDYRNCFLNLALPDILQSEPGAAHLETLKPGVTFTQWDRWCIYGNADFTLQMFNSHFKEKYGLEVSFVSQGVKPIYLPALPTHAKRLKNTMVKLLRPTTSYVDLVVSFQPPKDDDDDLSAPPIRYFFGL